MAFSSGPAQEEDFGSGGKVLRGRLHLTRFSPYSRLPSSAVPLEPSEQELEVGRTPSWFRGFISGAGKLISSVLGSEGSGTPSECSSDYSSDEECNFLPNEHEDHLYSANLNKSSKRENVMEGNADSLAIISKSESKLIIEQLILQETFTSEEYIKLMELLRSRVPELPSAKGGEGIQKVVSETLVERPWSLDQNRNISGSFNASPSNLSAFSPRYYVSEAVTPDLRNRAVMEAKNWFKEKKLSPSPIRDQEFGTCILNTDMQRYCFDSDAASPIEMAKSYMQSLPPWRSPSFSATGLNNPTSSGWHAACSIGSQSSLASKVKEGDYSSIVSLHSSRVPLKSSADDLGSSKLKQAGSASRPPFFEVSRTLPTTTNSGNKVHDESLRLHDREVIEAGHLKEFSQGNIVELQVSSKEAQEMPEIAPGEQLSFDIDSIHPRDADINMSDIYQNVEIPSVIEAQSGRGKAGQSFSETVSAKVNPVEPRTGGSKKRKIETDSVVQANPDSDYAHSINDSQPPDNNPQNPKEATELAVELDANGHVEEINNENSGLESMSKGGPAATNSNNSVHVPATSVSEGTNDHPSHVSSENPRPQAVDRNANYNPQNGTTKKSDDRLVADPSLYGKGKRRAKKVVRQKRWNG